MKVTMFNNRHMMLGVYRHFKGKYYLAMHLAAHTETGETMVVYMALYGDGAMYVRPLEMFLSDVDKTEYPDVAQQYRFELMKEGML